ncbi:MAG TPA: phosphodiester glycosidase family protein [Daejeonella sp.]|nr:phosphodiester glycosidase family protein [Daejeonella sp.]
MKRFILSLFFCGLLQLSSAAQQTDSLNVVNAKWIVQKVSRGVKLKTYQFQSSLFGSNQNVSILEVKPKRKYHFELGFEKQLLRTTSDFGKSAQALAALNGTFFDIKNGGSVDFIKANGQVVNENRLDKNDNRSIHQQSAVILKDGKLAITKWDGQANWEQNLDAQSIMVSGPLLILNNQTESLDTANAFNKTRHPRSAIAVKKNKRVLLITVDGRHENSAGMSLFELSKLMRWLGAREGINLDGGGSTALWVNNQPENGVVNYPSDNKAWDHQGERKVANVILLRKR